MTPHEQTDMLHPTGRCSCGGGGQCAWCLDVARREAAAEYTSPEQASRDVWTGDGARIVADDCGECLHARTSHVRKIGKSPVNTACVVPGCRCLIFVEMHLTPARLSEIRTRVAHRSRVAAPDDRRLLLDAFTAAESSRVALTAEVERLGKLVAELQERLAALTAPASPESRRDTPA